MGATTTVARGCERRGPRGFTLVELVIALGVGVVLISFAGVITTEVNQLISRSRETSAAADQGAALERQMRRDLSRLATDQFMVIRQSNVRLTAPGVVLAESGTIESGAVIYRSDQLMFFAKGEFTTARLDPRTVVNDPAPNNSGDVSHPTELPAEIVNDNYQALTGRPAAGVDPREPLATSGSAARIWYGHLITPASRTWPADAGRPEDFPPRGWTIGRHRLVLVDNEPLGLRDSGSGEVVRPHDTSFGRAEDQRIIGSLFAPAPQSWVADPSVPEIVGDLAAAAGTNSGAWSSSTPLPALWNAEFVRGRVHLREDDLDPTGGGPGSASPLFLPVDMALTSLSEIRRFLRPTTFRDPIAVGGPAAIESQARFQFDLMRRACFPVEGSREWDLVGRQLVFDDGASDFVPLAEPDALALRDRSYDVNDEAYLLGQTVIPYASSFRVEWAGDMDGDGVLDRYVEEQTDRTGAPYRGLDVALIKDLDPDGGIDDLFFDLNNNFDQATFSGEFEPAYDVRIGEPVWYGLDVLSLVESDIPDQRRVPVGFAETDRAASGFSASDFVDVVNASGNLEDFRIDSNNTLDGYALFGDAPDQRDGGPPAGVTADALFLDQVFGYPEEFGGRWPRLLRITVTQRGPDGRIIGTNIDNDAELLRETGDLDERLGVDLEAARTQFIIELPARAR